LTPSLEPQPVPNLPSRNLTSPSPTTDLNRTPLNSNLPPILTSSQSAVKTSPTPPSFHPPNLTPRSSHPNTSNNPSSMTIIGTVVHVVSNQVWICPWCNKPDDSMPMIGCDSCDDWYHWHCVGITKEPPENQNWYCHKCGNTDKNKSNTSAKPATPTTPMPIGSSPNEETNQ